MLKNAVTKIYEGKEVTAYPYALNVDELLSELKQAHPDIVLIDTAQSDGEEYFAFQDGKLLIQVEIQATNQWEYYEY